MSIAYFTGFIRKRFMNMHERGQRMRELLSIDSADWFGVRSKNSMKGFTLLELLTVMLLVSTIGLTIVSIVVVSLRGTSKAAAVTLIRQEGNFVVSQMSKTIRFAKTLDTPDPCAGATSTIAVTAVDGTVTTYTYNNVSQTILQNGVSLFNTAQLAVPQATFTCTQQTVSDPPTIAINFTLERKNSGTNADSTASLEFETTVALRNWQR